jgi:hypothetical protein
MSDSFFVECKHLSNLTSFQKKIAVERLSFVLLCTVTNLTVLFQTVVIILTFVNVFGAIFLSAIFTVTVVNVVGF